MTDSADESHVRQLLGPYLLGVLDARERDAVEHHLAVCPACLAECDELGEVVAMLALISEEDGREIVEEFGAPPLAAPEPANATAPAPRPLAAATPLASEVTRTVAAIPPGPDRPTTDAVPPGRSPASVVGPAHRRPSSAPASRPKNRRRVRVRSLLGIAGPVLVVLASAVAFIGLAGGGEDGGGKPTAPVEVALAASAAASTDGATLSVVAAGPDGSVTVRATVTGLKTGVRYQLHAVTTDGATHPVAAWPGSADAREVTGEVPVPVSALSFFAVTRADGTAVLSAYVKVPPSPSR
ncbi:zf-HC2 domain-containing protein [Micromonospora sp. DT233]|uniref:zf-HC2 domain-containing protein n=1 Tax=Micromonospora sp. DT233 TaxID=3393432 RepID=UPI003CF6A5D7